MNVRHRVALSAMLFPALLTFHSAHAEGTSGWEGTAGLGALVVPRYTGGQSQRLVAAPIVDASYKDVVRIELFRATAYLGSSQDRKMGWGLAVEPRFGFHASDGPRLSGLAKRGDSLEGGPSFDWDLGVADLNVSWFRDFTGRSGGTSFNATIQKDLVETPRWELSINGGFDRLSARTANYYFGVAPGEAVAGRPSYRPGTGVNLVAGAKGLFRLDARHSIEFGTYATRLNAAAAASPIVETRVAKIFWLGFGWTL